MNYEYKPPENKCKLARIIDNWYEGSTVQKFEKTRPNRKGDKIGLLYMFLYAMCLWAIVSFLPIYLFWGMIAIFNPLVMIALNLILAVSYAFTLPQIMFLWDQAFDFYLKKTGFKEDGKADNQLE
jgi:hypothetical protein